MTTDLILEHFSCNDNTIDTGFSLDYSVFQFKIVSPNSGVKYYRSGQRVYCSDVCYAGNNKK